MLESRRRHDAFKKYWGELTTPTANSAGPRGERLRLAAKTSANRIITSRRAVFPLAAFHGRTTRSMRLPHDLEHGVVAVLFGEETARVLEAFLGSEQALASGATA